MRIPNGFRPPDFEQQTRQSQWILGSFISKVGYAPFKGVFWNTDDAVVKLMASITSFFVIKTLFIKICKIRTTTTNAENLWQYKSRHSPIVEHILAFASSTNFVREVKNLSPNVKRIA